jgi:hypothetical protein
MASMKFMEKKHNTIVWPTKKASLIVIVMTKIRGREMYLNLCYVTDFTVKHQSGRR